MDKTKKKNVIIEGVLILVVLVALFHTGANIIKLATTQAAVGISGNTILDNLKENYSNLSFTSRWIIAGEWLLVLVVILYLLIKGKMKLSEEIREGEALKSHRAEPKYRKLQSETDLDVLYNLLKENKTLRLKSISEFFNITKDTAMEWCKILEEGDLATIKYPTVGDPKITLNEEEKKEEIE